ncbi:hypothetical protein DLAC_04880 [Tieghemostelium lacteum]|uniref:Response regulatory domain-containing protein n=1 Tax=Tieghemostelium lacteum TaxID=361077 RepID=A0A151ZJ55_TIELA|nr:hypothetical protein DLAC_04880 [Tieghemostelium lacteum]|eukprot:KYQ93986.1 hypothetical protein DLAC_04880 [Tieghemostelium lacteum]
MDNDDGGEDNIRITAILIDNKNKILHDINTLFKSFSINNSVIINNHALTQELFDKAIDNNVQLLTSSNIVLGYIGLPTTTGIINNSDIDFLTECLTWLQNQFLKISKRIHGVVVCTNSPSPMIIHTKRIERILANKMNGGYWCVSDTPPRNIESFQQILSLIYPNNSLTPISPPSSTSQPHKFITPSKQPSPIQTQQQQQFSPFQKQQNISPSLQHQQQQQIQVNNNPLKNSISPIIIPIASPSPATSTLSLSSNESNMSLGSNSSISSNNSYGHKVTQLSTSKKFSYDDMDIDSPISSSPNVARKNSSAIEMTNDSSSSTTTTTGNKSTNSSSNSLNSSNKGSTSYNERVLRNAASVMDNSTKIDLKQIKSLYSVNYLNNSNNSININNNNPSTSYNSYNSYNSLNNNNNSFNSNSSGNSYSNLYSSSNNSFSLPIVGLEDSYIDNQNSSKFTNQPPPPPPPPINKINYNNRGSSFYQNINQFNNNNNNNNININNSPITQNNYNNEFRENINYQIPSPNPSLLSPLSSDSMFDEFPHLKRTDADSDILSDDIQHPDEKINQRRRTLLPSLNQIDKISKRLISVNYRSNIPLIQQQLEQQEQQQRLPPEHSSLYQNGFIMNSNGMGTMGHNLHHIGLLDQGSSHMLLNASPDVMVVEDNEMNAGFLLKLLEKFGVVNKRCIWVTDGLQAVQSYQSSSQPFRLILMDLFYANNGWLSSHQYH